MSCMDRDQNIKKIYTLSEQFRSAISDDDWALATEIFQQRDMLIHQLLDNISDLDDQASAETREMIIRLQQSDQLLIDKVTLLRDKLLSDVRDASVGQKATEAYAKNI